MALERGLEGRDQLLKLVKRHAREIQELHRTGLQLGEPYTCHGSCLLSLYCDVRGASYQKESGINSYEPRNPIESEKFEEGTMGQSCIRALLFPLSEPLGQEKHI